MSRNSFYFFVFDSCMKTGVAVNLIVKIFTLHFESESILQYKKNFFWHPSLDCGYATILAELGRILKCFLD